MLKNENEAIGLARDDPCTYCKPPYITGLIYFRKGFFMGFYTGSEAYIWGLTRGQ